MQTSEDGKFWYGAFKALHALCLKEKAGQLVGGHEMIETLLPELLDEHGLPHRRPKHGDTGIHVHHGALKERVHLRWRVHLKSGPPRESESLYWEPIGDSRQDRRFLIGWIGWHPE